MKLKIQEKSHPKHGKVYNVVSYETRMGMTINTKVVAGSYVKKVDAEKTLKALQEKV